MISSDSNPARLWPLTDTGLGEPAQPPITEPKAQGSLDRLVRLAAQLFHAPMAVIVLDEEGGQRVRARWGPRDDPWLESPYTPWADDAGPTFGQDLVAPRFHAAAGLATAEGRCLGVLRVADMRAHDPPTENDRAALLDLADLIVKALEHADELEALRRRRALDQQRGDLALGAADMGGYDWDLATDVVTLTDRCHALVGLPGEASATTTGAILHEYVHPDDRDGFVRVAEEGLRRDGRFRHEYRIVRPLDGSTVWVSSTAIAVDGMDGPPRRLIGLLQDITARKLEEQQRETLVAELDHRVKNVLSSVQSLAAQSVRKASSLESFLKTFGGRLKSMASAHQLLTATRWQGAEMHNIAAAELGGLAPGQTRWEGPYIVLTPRATNALSLALHELATNAVKFGALSTETGRISVNWWNAHDGGLMLRWAEMGGPLVAGPARNGFGTTLLEKVTGRELGGEVRIDFRAEGVQAMISVGPSALAEAVKPVAEPLPEQPPRNLAGASEGAPSASQAARVEGLRILIVEDALLLALELEAGLQEAGAVIVGAAADLEEAMGMIDLPLDAAVLDANLNGVSVTPVAEALARRGVPFVFATGYGDNKLAPQGYDVPVIRKPYDVTQVAAALAQVTRRT